MRDKISLLQERYKYIILRGVLPGVRISLLLEFVEGRGCSVCSLKLFLFYIFLAPGGGSPLYPEILQYNTMILQCIRIIVVDAGFEPRTSAPEVWRATNEPPHLPGWDFALS